MGNNLIISDHTRLWSKKNNILIGDWCNPNYKKNFLKKEKYVTINYHWKKKEKIRKDLIYLNKLYEFLLNELTIKLNNYHKIKFSKRCWEVILSKWLWFHGRMAELNGVARTKFLNGGWRTQGRFPIWMQCRGAI